jgi:hypothetical protein
MADRLKDLQRQRALVQEQLAWLEREIARESGGLPPATAAPTAPIPDAPLVGYTKETPGSMAENAKRGCLLAFLAGMFVFFSAVLAAYLLYRSRH